MLVVGVEAVSAAGAFGVPTVDGVGEPCFADDFSCGVDDLDVRWHGEHLFTPVVLDRVDGQPDAGRECADRQTTDSHAPKNTPVQVVNTPVRVYSLVMATTETQAPAEIVALLIEDDDSAYVHGLYASDDEALADLRQYLVERFGEDTVAEAEGDQDQGLGGLVHYTTDGFAAPPLSAGTTVWVLEIEHRHGRNVDVYASEEAARSGLIGWVHDWWLEVVGVEAELGDGRRVTLQSEPPSDDDEAIDQYFAAKSDEYYDLGTTALIR